MEEDIQRKAWRIFERVIDLRDGERSLVLADVRQTEPRVAEEVESLLRHDAAAGKNPFWGRGLPNPEAESPPVSEEIGPYRIVREIGHGGMGVVYEAVHVDMGLDKHVALKVLTAQRTADTQSIERFYREARLAASLHHTHIVPVLNAGIHEGQPWYAMAYVRGANLSAVVRHLQRIRAGCGTASDADAATATYQSTGDAGPAVEPARPDEEAPVLPPLPCLDVASSEYFRWVAQLGIQAAKGLDYAHHAEGRGVVHRDIKPGNLLLDEEGTLWIADFGLARRRTDAALTADGNVLGTPCYMSPEQAAGMPVDHRSDIYSLGATLYELLTLRPVFSGTLQSVLQQIGAKEPDSPRRHNSAIPRDLEAIVEKAIAKRPDGRYPSAGALAEDLERWLSNRPIRARRISVVGRAVRWCRREPVAVLLLVSLVAGSCTSLYFGLAAGAHARDADEARSLADRRATEAGAQAMRADQQAERADQQTAVAVANARESHRRLVAHHVSSGVQLLDSGDALAALPWFVEALRLDVDHPDRVRAHRFRIAAAMEASPKLLHAWFHVRRVRGLHLSSDERRVITVGDDGLVEVHDINTGELLSSASFGGPVLSFSASADGRRVAVCTVFGTAHLWDPSNNVDLGAFLGGRRDLKRVLLSGDGLRLATLHGDREVRVWNLAAANQQTGPIDHPNDVSAWSFSPDGRRLLTGTGSSLTPQFNQVQAWDAETGSALIRPLMHADDVRAVSWSGDGKRIATADWAGMAHVWDAASGEPVMPHPVLHDAPITQAFITPDGRFLVTAGEDQTVRVWDIGQAVPIAPRLQHGGPVLDLQLAPDETCLAAAGFDRSVRFWNAHDGSSPLPRLPHLATVDKIAASRDGLVATASEDGTARVWDVCARSEPEESFWTGASAELARLSPDGTRLLTITGPHNSAPTHFARVWNAATGAPLSEPMHHDGLIDWADFSPDGQLVVTAGQDGTARLWKAAGGAAASEPLRHSGRVFYAVFHPDGNRLLTAGADGTARLWDVATGQERWRVTHAAAVNRAALSGAGHLIATASQDGTAQIWDALTGEPYGPPLKHEGAVLEVAFSPDGRRLATASSNKAARLWNVNTGEPLSPPLEHGHLVRAIAFSPDSKRLATGSYDWTARIWDAGSGEPLTPFLQHDDFVNCVAFSSDGLRLATASGGPQRSLIGEARVWDVATGEPLTAWLRHGNDVYDCRFDAAGDFLYTACWDGRVRKWKLPYDDRPLEDLQFLAELWAGYRIDKLTGVALVQAADFRSRWTERGRSGLPHVARSAADLVRWHQRRLATALRKRDGGAAGYHLLALAGFRPNDASLLWPLATSP